MGGREVTSSTLHTWKCNTYWHGEAYQNRAGQAASTNTASLTHPGRRLTLQITLCGAQGDPLHTERLRAAQGAHGGAGALWHDVSVHTLGT